MLDLKETDSTSSTLEYVDLLLQRKGVLWKDESCTLKNWVSPEVLTKMNSSGNAFLFLGENSANEFCAALEAIAESSILERYKELYIVVHHCSPEIKVRLTQMGFEKVFLGNSRKMAELKNELEEQLNAWLPQTEKDQSNQAA